MPREREIITECHNRIRRAMAFFMDHVIMHHVCGYEMGRLVLRFVIERLTDLQEMVEAEIHLLEIDEGLIVEDEFAIEEDDVAIEQDDFAIEEDDFANSSSANSEDEQDEQEEQEDREP